MINLVYFYRVRFEVKYPDGDKYKQSIYVIAGNINSMKRKMQEYADKLGLPLRVVSYKQLVAVE